MTRRVFALVCAVATVVLAGCVSIKAIVISQPNPGGPVHFEVTLCATDVGVAPVDVDHAGCNFPANSGDASSGTEANPTQLLLGVRVPAGTEAPETLDGTEPEPGKEITFTRSDTYESELNKFLPPGNGREWIGWISNEYAYLEGTVDVAPARETTVGVDLSLPSGEGGGPFAGPFRFRWVAGGRAVAPPELPATRQVDCGESIYPIEGSAPSLCIDAPSPAVVEGADAQFNSKDFGITVPAAEGSPGQTFVLPFILATTGPIGAGPTAALAASTNLPGLTVAPSPSSVPLANDLRQRVEVPVTIPAGAAPGTYDVALTATLPTGETRSSVARLNVRDRQKPVLARLGVKPKRFKPSAPSLVAAVGTRVSFNLSENATVRFTVQRKRGRRFRNVKGSFTRAGSAGANSVRFTGFLRGKALRRGRYRLVATPTDAESNRGKAKRTGFRIRG